jgi:hypothetical protein
VQIKVAGVANLGTYEWQLAFDPNVVSFESATNGGFLGSTGRTPTCQLIKPPGIDENGDTIIQAPEDIVMPAGNGRFGCVTTGSEPGPDGGGLVSTVTFQPVGNGAPNIGFVCAGLADPFAGDIPVSNVAACVSAIVPTPGPGETPGPGDTPGPGETPAPTSVPQATSTPTGPLPTPTPLPPGLEAVPLAPGCNPVASTYADATPVEIIVGAVGPEGNLVSLWSFALGTWLGYSPQYPEVSDLTEMDFLDVVFTCVNIPGALVRPLV